MAQIGKDYYEDLTAERLCRDHRRAGGGQGAGPGPQTGRYASEPKSGLTSLTAFEADRACPIMPACAAVDLGDTVKRIDGSEVPLLTPWRDKGAMHRPAAPSVKTSSRSRSRSAEGRAGTPVDKTGDLARGAGQDQGQARGSRPRQPATAPDDSRGRAGHQARTLDAPREGKADDLKMIKGVGPKLEALLHKLGFFCFDQWRTGRRTRSLGRSEP